MFFKCCWRNQTYILPCWSSCNPLLVVSPHFRFAAFSKPPSRFAAVSSRALFRLRLPRPEPPAPSPPADPRPQPIHPRVAPPSPGELAHPRSGQAPHPSFPAPPLPPSFPPSLSLSLTPASHTASHWLVLTVSLSRRLSLS